jgi:hypothetical protein
VTLPTDPKERKGFPVCTGVLDYFPDAIAAVAAVSKAGNEQHNPGEPLHWARGKSMDQADTIVRHLMERGTLDTDGHRHSAKVAWRALALLQLEIEAATGCSISRGSSAAESPIAKDTQPLKCGRCLALMETHDLGKLCPSCVHKQGIVREAPTKL